MKETNNYTVHMRKKKLGGKPMIIGLGQRIIEWEKKNRSAKNGATKVSPPALLISYVRMHLLCHK